MTYHQCRCSQQSPSKKLQKYDDDSMVNTGGPETLRLWGDTYTTVKNMIVKKLNIAGCDIEEVTTTGLPPQIFFISDKSRFWCVLCLLWENNLSMITFLLIRECHIIYSYIVAWQCCEISVIAYKVIPSPASFFLKGTTQNTKCKLLSWRNLTKLQFFFLHLRHIL